jgi:hypothetical protein
MKVLLYVSIKGIVLLQTKSKVNERTRRHILLKPLVIIGYPKKCDDTTYVAYKVKIKIEVAKKTSGKNILK